MVQSHFTSKKIARQSQPWLFLGLTLALTWLLEFLAAGILHRVPEGIVLVLRYLAGVTPIAVAAGLAHLRHDRAFQRDFWERIIDVRRIPTRWWLVIFLFVPVKAALAALGDVLLGGEGIALEAAARFLAQPLLILPTLLFWLIFGPLPEEPGWRGYALDGLQVRRGPLAASLIIGVVWSLWHLPLFFIESTWQATAVGLGTRRFWLYMFHILLDAPIYTWIYNHTHRSTLAAVLFHFSVNGFGEAFALTPRAEVFQFLLAILAAVLVVLFDFQRSNG